MAAQHPESGQDARSPWPRVGAIVLLLTALLSVIMIAFAWPATRSTVHDIPLAVAGPPQAVAQVTQQLESRRPGAFDLVQVSDTAAAERLIRDREVYGAIDLSTGRPHLIIASAASPAVAQALQQVAQGLNPGGTAVAVRDLVPLPADDPRGAGLAAGALPLVLGGIVAAGLLTNLIAGTVRRVAGALAFAVTGGFALVAILQFWLGSIEGDYWANSGVVALSIAATALTVLGLESLFGTAGLGLGAAVMMLLGNPLSGLASAPEMLPAGWGALGQYLPPGAAGSLLRSVSFFDGGGATPHLLVLLGWAALGLILVGAAGLRRSRRPGRAEARELSPV
ncbi:ABC transporter permease [Dactylosporangium roseum]|uniref:ABC transporter permease n=1 Tax=Dactylosporangium roseum TaxID=47989 RepID=A0ABY5Z3P7_9ACTN|nr:ABC transporter permease [Dactylosporangium roseum]UWZ36259.1 ABC transporter permease [Dactylosporangium roseum]